MMRDWNLEAAEQYEAGHIDRALAAATIAVAEQTRIDNLMRFAAEKSLTLAEAPMVRAHAESVRQRNAARAEIAEGLGLG
ncbi:hypothetical protein QT381_02745 [Galbitalea sp. SE-J8]|uniref:hypothetical protein n=1 Tax=Galbitalea sp. SE-J8 TaxID=3054952 RepID=UPI00259C8678|nr:hypothetical protein [Galbitalea sp. SE-J8]MDM4761922.1 hypothetical protein [Galbitalea sp. SE-J8]